MQVVGLVHLLAAALLVAVCLPLKRRRVPRNAWYGVRLPAALASDEAWYACNEYFARRMLAWTVPFALWGLGEWLVLDRIPLPWRNLAPFVVLIFLAIPMVQAVRWRPPAGGG